MEDSKIEPQAAPAAPPEAEPVANEPVLAPEEPLAEVADRKRKHEDLDGGGPENGAVKLEVEAAIAEEKNGVGGSVDGVEVKTEGVEDVVVGTDDGGVGDLKRQRVEAETHELVSDTIKQVQSGEFPTIANGQVSVPLEGGDVSHAHQENKPELPAAQMHENAPYDDQKPNVAIATSLKMQIPNGRVGVLIGKAGETIKYLQFNTGAKIQIQRDMDAEPGSDIRIVEIVGAPDSISKAEQLIKDVMAEADAGGSPALVARGFGTLHSGSEQLELKVPNEKVGMIIGKGGETIKNLQTRSGARIQLIPQHLPDGDSSRERTVRISGNKKQIEAATDMIKDVMSQGPGRPSSFSRSHYPYRPHGPAASPQWSSRPMQPGTGYDYQQRAPYQSQNPHYPQSYGGYTQQQHQQQHQQPAPRGNFGSGWEQRPSQAPPSQGGGYNYYGQGQGSHPVDVQQPGPPQGLGGPAPPNYYGQPQSSGYGQAQYSQPVSTQPSYTQGYGEQRYDVQASTQQVYGQQPISNQPVQYQQANPQTGFQQQAYNRPVYAAPPSQTQAQAYGPPSGNPTDQAYQSQYQGQNPPQNYASTLQPQYPYGSAVPQVYGSSTTTQDSYVQQSSGGYPQYAVQTTTGYAQTSQAAPAYQQVGQTGYAQYPQQPQQQAYSEPAPTNAGYGYQGAPANAGYGAPVSGFGAAPVTGAGYAQAPANPAGYDQSISQPSYPAPSGAQAPYTKSLSPQPQAQPQPQAPAQQTGYVQYDGTQSQVYGLT